MSEKRVYTEEEAIQLRKDWGQSLWELQNLHPDSKVSEFEEWFRMAPFSNEKNTSKHIHAMANVFYDGNLGHALLAFLIQRIQIGGQREETLMSESNDLGRFMADRMTTKLKESWEDDE